MRCFFKKRKEENGNMFFYNRFVLWKMCVNISDINSGGVSD